MLKVKLLSAHLVMVAIFFATATTACSSNRDESVQKGHADQTGADLSDVQGELARPLTTEERFVVQNGWDRLVSECMASAGFSWHVVTSRNVPGDPNPYPNVEELRRSGYSADFEAMVSANKDANQRFLEDPVSSVPESQKAAFQKAFEGTEKVTINTPDGTSQISTDGCAAEANAQIYGSVENAFWLSQAVEVATPDHLSVALSKIPAYSAATSKWQDCMRGRGVNWMDGEGAYAGWDTGFLALRTKMIIDDAAPSQEDQDKVSNDDADCLESSGLGQIRPEHLMTVKDKLWSSAEINEVDKWRLQQSALANAKAV